MLTAAAFLPPLRGKVSAEGRRMRGGRAERDGFGLIVPVGALKVDQTQSL
jgi:hypothetical protein